MVEVPRRKCMDHDGTDSSSSPTVEKEGTSLPPSPLFCREPPPPPHAARARGSGGGREGGELLLAR